MDEKKICENQMFNKAVLLRVRQKCLEKGTSITKIEETLGYGNGSISTGWAKAKKKAPMERIEAVAKILDCIVNDLLPQSDDGEKKEPAPINENEFTKLYVNLSTEHQAELDRYARYLQSLEAEPKA